MLKTPLSTRRAIRSACKPGATIPRMPAYEEPRNYDNSYQNVLPSLNLRMKVRDDLQFRFAIAKAISRPDFTQLQGYTTLTQSANTINNGTFVSNVSQTGEGSILFQDYNCNLFGAACDTHPAPPPPTTARPGARVCVMTLMCSPPPRAAGRSPARASASPGPCAAAS